MMVEKTMGVVISEELSERPRSGSFRDPGVRQCFRGQRLRHQ